MYDLCNKKILILGGSSMLGRAAYKYLLPYSDSIYVPIHTSDCCIKYKADLKQTADVNNLFVQVEPDIVICAQGWNGNIEFNKRFPDKIFYNTVKMAMNILDAARRYQVDKILSFISSCAYPSIALLQENYFWNGKPDDSVSAHGFSKRFIIEYAEQLTKLYDFEHIGMVINTAYGPWDNFNPNKSKVIGSLISKFYTAKKQNLPEIVLLGDGNNRREFIYCDDVGRYMIKLLQSDDKFPLINIGSGVDYSIKELAEMISNIFEYEGKIKWSGESGGQKQKLLDNRMMKETFGNLGFVPLETGLRKTISWYKENCNV